jgi:ribosome-interacting GTPase 1
LPANLTADAQAKWQEGQAAKNPKEKLRLLEEFLSAIPRHKGNERLSAQTKTKIAALKEEIAIQRGKRGGGRSLWAVEREGAAQVMMFGPTNAGRSSLLRSLTNAQVTVASYEYTTRRPVPGMLQYAEIQFQLVEVPAPQLTPDGSFQLQPEAVNLIRSSDGLMLVVDLSSNAHQQPRSVVSALEDIRISIQKPLSRVEIVNEKGSGEIRIATSGTQKSVTHAQIRDLLHKYGIRNALVRIYGDASLDDVEDAILENVMIYKPTLVVANKVDLPEARRASADFTKGTPNSLPIVLTSCLTGEGLKNLGEALFYSLGIIRVYTKEPNESKPSQFPFVVRAGTTVGELARSIHTDLAKKYRYSRIWGPTSKFAGERVGPDHVLEDRDVVEIHTGQ